MEMPDHEMKRSLSPLCIYSQCLPWAPLFCQCCDLWNTLCKVLYTLNINHGLSVNTYLNSKAKCFGSLLNKPPTGEQLTDKTSEKKDIIITSSFGREYSSLSIAILLPHFVSFPYCKNQAVRYLRLLPMRHMVHALEFQHASQ